MQELKKKIPMKPERMEVGLFPETIDPTTKLGSLSFSLLPFKMPVPKRLASRAN